MPQEQTHRSQDTPPYSLQDTQGGTEKLFITEAAFQRLTKLLPEETTRKGMPQRLRISIEGGGCSGFQYRLTFDDTVQTEDRIFRYETAEVIIDETSLRLISGSLIDFQADLMREAFFIKNPQATASCGCGSSFSVF